MADIFNSFHYLLLVLFLHKCTTHYSFKDFTCRELNRSSTLRSFLCLHIDNENASVSTHVSESEPVSVFHQAKPVSSNHYLDEPPAVFLLNRQLQHSCPFFFIYAGLFAPVIMLCLQQWQYLVLSSSSGFICNENSMRLANTCIFILFFYVRKDNDSYKQNIIH